MFHENHCRRTLFYQLLKLHTGINIHKIEWFIPYIQMSLFTKTFGNQYLFPLSIRKILYILFKLYSFKVHLP